MSKHEVGLDRLLDLAGTVCDDGATQDECRELDSMMLADREAFRCYLGYCRMHSALRLELRAQRAVQGACQRAGIELPPCDNLDTARADAIVSPALPSTPSLYYSGLSYLSSGWPVAYLIATVAVGVGLAIAAFTHVSRYEEVAVRSPLTAVDRKSDLQPKAEAVGRITGMADCDWAGAAVDSSRVLLGQKYELTSGLMEITYNTGAKVILQGPVTYEVESKNGGFLSIGKLTGKMEAKTAKGFTITTPTATVTDLGTEFAVEVNKEGVTASYVFRGVVEMRSVARKNVSQDALRLEANESARIDSRGNAERAGAANAKVDPTVFVRAEDFQNRFREQHFASFRRWQAYSEKLRRDPSLIAYYDFQQIPDRPETLANVAGSGDRSLDGIVENAAWSTGRMPGKHALFFNNPGDYVRINLPRQTDDLTLAAWVFFNLFDVPSANALLMSNGWETRGKICWQVSNARRVCFASTSVVGEPGNAIMPAPLGKDRVRQWIHLACVCDRKAQRVQFYVDGENAGESPYRIGHPLAIGAARIGNWDPDNIPYERTRNFLGRIDELAVFARPLADGEVQQMYMRGKP